MKILFMLVDSACVSHCVAPYSFWHHVCILHHHCFCCPPHKFSKKGNKLLAICSSHLIVLSLFFGQVIFTCMTPGSSNRYDQHQTVSIFLNCHTHVELFIYSLRNKDALRVTRKISELFQIKL